MATITKSKKVENFLRGNISQGVWKPGARIPDVDQISGELGVSNITVKGVLAQLASDGLVDRIQKKGTFVSQKVSVASVVILAQAYSFSSSHSNHYRIFLERAVQNIESYGYQPVLRLGYGDTPEKFLSSIQFPHGLTSKETVGIISLAGMEEALSKLGVPYVSLVMAPFGNCSHGVIMDYGAMYQMGSQKLSEHGYDDFVIMYMEPPAGERGSEMFTELHRQRLEAVNGQSDRLLVCPYSPDCRYAYESFKRYWQAGPRSRAIFFSDEVVFDVASRAILELGIKVPEELAFITQGITGVHYHFPIPVACVEFDAARNAAVMWDRLQSFIVGHGVEEPVFVKPQFRDGQTL